jgi:cytochrome c oxidase subunit II
VRALPKDQFAHYMQIRGEINPGTDLPYTAADALTKLGQDDPTCGDLCIPHAVTTHPFDTSRTEASGQ